MSPTQEEVAKAEGQNSAKRSTSPRAVDSEEGCHPRAAARHTCSLFRELQRLQCQAGRGHQLGCVDAGRRMHVAERSTAEFGTADLAYSFVVSFLDCSGAERRCAALGHVHFYQIETGPVREYGLIDTVFAWQSGGGKTVISQALSKHSNFDVLAYVGLRRAQNRDCRGCSPIPQSSPHRSMARREP